MNGVRSKGLVVCLVGVAFVCAGFFIHERQKINERSAVNAESSLGLFQGGRTSKVVLRVKNLGPASLSIVEVRAIDRARNDKIVVLYDPRKYLALHETDSLSSFPLSQLSDWEYLKTKGYAEGDYMMIQGIAKDETGKEFQSNTLTIQAQSRLDNPPPYIQ